MHTLLPSGENLGLIHEDISNAGTLFRRIGTDLSYPMKRSPIFFNDEPTYNNRKYFYKKREDANCILCFFY